MTTHLIDTPLLPCRHAFAQRVADRGFLRPFSLNILLCSYNIKKVSKQPWFKKKGQHDSFYSEQGTKAAPKIQNDGS